MENQSFNFAAFNQVETIQIKEKEFYEECSSLRIFSFF